MNKYYLLLVLALLILGCSSDNDTPKELSGQYVFENDTLTMSICFGENGRYVENGKTATLQIFLRNNIEYQNLYNTTYVGDYPKYTITTKDDGNLTASVLVLNCHFSSSQTFDATVSMSGLNDVYWNYSRRHIYLPPSMTFKKSDDILDKNGDGILDKSQGF